MQRAERISLLLQQIALQEDEHAFHELFELMYARLYFFALQILHDEVVVEDCIADVFLALWLKRKNLTEIVNFQGYLYRSVRNTALNLHKQQQRHPTCPLERVLDVHLVDFPADQNILREELEQALAKAVVGLPVRCRQIYLMAQEEELKYKEIGCALGISVKTVDAQIAIARARIQRVIGRFYE